ncbi:MAG: hypothetical protein LBE51_12860 [Acidovorax sp.]|jgi:hypothetical protein|nr:hypothetical protein [Acidovorax sp.]
MWQEILVSVIVAAAVLSLLWRYLPLRWRQRAGRVHPALAPKASSAGACGGCSACGGDSCASSVRKS